MLAYCSTLICVTLVRVTHVLELAKRQLAAEPAHRLRGDVALGHVHVAEGRAAREELHGRVDVVGGELLHAGALEDHGAPVDLDPLVVLRQRAVLALPRQAGLAERRRLDAPRLDERRLLQRPDLERARPPEAELFVEPDRALVLLEHLERDGRRREVEHSLHQPPAQSLPARRGHDPEPADPTSVVANAEVDETLAGSDERPLAIEVPAVDEHPKGRLVDRHRHAVALVRAREQLRVLGERQGRRADERHATSACAKSCASNGRRSSRPSPTPTSFTGSPSSYAIAT